MTDEVYPDQHRRRLIAAAFRMPSVQTMVSRKSSITNAFVSAVIPVVPPTHQDVEDALRILGMTPDLVYCAYCGDRASEWDHLRPLVMNRRPTGFISEIANLVPACGKCNQSKGNRAWRQWISSSARLSPSGRGVPDIATRANRLEAYEAWRPPTKINFASVVGLEQWENYWALCEDLIEEMKRCQAEADKLRADIARFATSGPTVEE